MWSFSSMDSVARSPQETIWRAGVEVTLVQETSNYFSVAKGIPALASFAPEGAEAGVC